jgi:putative aminopeptidase FrvX
LGNQFQDDGAKQRDFALQVFVAFDEAAQVFVGGRAFDKNRLGVAAVLNAAQFLLESLAKSENDIIFVSESHENPPG